MLKDKCKIVPIKPGTPLSNINLWDIIDLEGKKELVISLTGNQLGTIGRNHRRGGPVLYTLRPKGDYNIITGTFVGNYSTLLIRKDDEEWGQYTQYLRQVGL